MRSVLPFAVILILVAGCFPGNNSTTGSSGGSSSGGSGKGGDAGSKGSGGGGGSAGASAGSGGQAGSGGGGSGGTTSDPADAALGGQGGGGGATGGSTGSAQGGSAGATAPSDARSPGDGRLGGGGTSSPGGGGGGGRTGGGGGGASGGGQGGSSVQGTGGSTAPTACTFPSSWTVGSATYTTYTLPADITACGYNGNKGANTIKNIVNAGYFAAIPGNSSSDFNTSNRCGACIQIGNAVVTIVDECPFQGNAPCQSNPTGHMDLGGSTAGAAGVKGDPNVRGQAQWKYVPCPVTGNVMVRLKQGNNNEVFIENEILPIASVTCAGQNGSRTSYGAWHFASDVPGATCEVTDVSNRKISITLGTQQNVDVDTKAQFPKCL